MQPKQNGEHSEDVSEGRKLIRLHLLGMTAICTTWNHEEVLSAPIMSAGTNVGKDG
jgi:hypothetical protein